MRLITCLLKPTKQIPGTEFAGLITEVGTNDQTLKSGDRVFGFDDEGAGAHAEYLSISEDKVVRILDGITYEQALASSEGAHYAMNFINKVDLKKNQLVLVNGATGAIGSAAVQLMKQFKVTVTAVCPSKQTALVKTLGADRVIDYTRDDFTKEEPVYNLVLDAVGKRSFFRCRRLLLPGGIYISSDLGYLAQNIYLPIVTHIINPLFGNKKKTYFPNREISGKVC